MTRRERRAIGLGAVVVAAVVLAGCGHAAGGAPVPSSTAGLPATDGPTVDVELQDYRFAPAAVEVAVGTAVRWTNRGAAPHSATAEDDAFDTGQLETGESAIETFATPGTFAYLCTLHPDMRGTVTVVAPEPSAATEPSVAPSSAADASPEVESSPSATRFEVDLVIATSHDVTAEVIDRTGRVTAATSGTPGDGASVANGTVAIANAGPTTLEITWAGGPCDRSVPVVLDGSTITVVQPPCEGDAIAFDRIVRLEFADDVDAATFTGVLQESVDTSS
jgi:plastocyanin